MKITFGILLIIIVSISCKNVKGPDPSMNSQPSQNIIKKDYELYKPIKEIKAVLLLFGGYPEEIEEVKLEFEILNDAMTHDIAVLFLNYNQKLWLEQNEKLVLANKLQHIFKEHNLPTENIYIGGFSSGGSVALLISNFITKNKMRITPKGVFIVDSPIDLAALYYSSEKNVERKFSEIAIQESLWLMDHLEVQFGNPNNGILNYEKDAVFTSETRNIHNVKYLKNTKIRLYTEPDTVWWKKNRMADYEQMNAYYIKKLSETLIDSSFTDVKYIPTIGKGKRANGSRHPHSWSIVDKAELINWMLNK